MPRYKYVADVGLVEYPESVDDAAIAEAISQYQQPEGPPLPESMQVSTRVTFPEEAEFSVQNAPAPDKTATEAGGLSGVASRWYEAWKRGDLPVMSGLTTLRDVGKGISDYFSREKQGAPANEWEGAPQSIAAFGVPATVQPTGREPGLPKTIGPSVAEIINKHLPQIPVDYATPRIPGQPLISPQQALYETFRGTALGAGDLVDSLKSPENSALIAMMPAASGVPLLKFAVDAGFSAQMLSSALEALPEAKQAFQDGDLATGSRLLFAGISSGALGLHMTKPAFEALSRMRRMPASPAEIEVYNGQRSLVLQDLDRVPGMTSLGFADVYKFKKPRGRMRTALADYGDGDLYPVEWRGTADEIVGYRNGIPIIRVDENGKIIGGSGTGEVIKASFPYWRGESISGEQNSLAPKTEEPYSGPGGQSTDSRVLNVAPAAGETAGSKAPWQQAGMPDQARPPSTPLEKELAPAVTTLRSSGIPAATDASLNDGVVFSWMGTGEFGKFRSKIIDDWLAKFRSDPKALEVYGPRAVKDFSEALEINAKLFPDQFMPEVVSGSPEHTNIDFGSDISLTTICPRQDKYRSTIHAVEAGIGKLLSSHEKFLVGQMMSDMGGTPACWFCYGQIARDEAESAIATFRQIYDRGVKMMRETDGKATDAQLQTQFETPQGTYWKVETKPGRTGKLAKLIRNSWNKYEIQKLVSDEVRLRDLAFGFTEAKNPLEAEIAREAMAVVQGATQANKPKGYSPYTDEFLRMSDAEVEARNSRAGQRFNSQTDFRIWHTISTAQGFAHAYIRGLMGHVYTREPAMIEIFGRTGMKFNISMEYGVNPDGTTMLDSSGRPVINEMNTMPFAKIEEFRRDYRNDVGTCLIPKDLEQVRMGMRDPRVGMLIPLHKGKIPQSAMVFQNAVDFTRFQHEQWPGLGSIPEMRDGPYKGRKGEPIRVQLSSGRVVKLRVGEGLTKKHHLNNKKDYLEICDRLGIYPRYPQFRNEPGYMKSVVDVAANPNRQLPLDPRKIDWEAANKYAEQWATEGGDDLEADPATVREILNRIEGGEWPKAHGTPESLEQLKNVYIEDKRAGRTPLMGRLAAGQKFVFDASPGSRIPKQPGLAKAIAALKEQGYEAEYTLRIDETRKDRPFVYEVKMIPKAVPSPTSEDTSLAPSR